MMTTTTTTTPAWTALDIETTGLDPAAPDAAVTDVAFYGAGWTGCISGDERTVLARTAARLAVMQGTVVTWNGSGFDWPYLLHRAAVHGIDLGVTVTGERQGKYRAGLTVAGRTWRHADVWVAWGPMMSGLHLPAGLKPVARLFGMDPIEVDRERMADLTDDERRAYALSDVRCTLGLAGLAGPNTINMVTDRPWHPSIG
jgi:DNA polymerase elongation subunit (family B)